MFLMPLPFKGLASYKLILANVTRYALHANTESMIEQAFKTLLGSVSAISKVCASGQC